jgi:hypothetical protein
MERCLRCVLKHGEATVYLHLGVRQPTVLLLGAGTGDYVLAELFGDRDCRSPTAGAWWRRLR